MSSRLRDTGVGMKNIIILIAMLLAFSAVAEAKVKIRKFEILKTQDGKVQFCKESSDYYQQGTYTIHDVDHDMQEGAIVKTKALAVGKKCSKYEDSNGSEVYIWRDLDLFSDYNYEVMHYVAPDFVPEYITVKCENLKLIVADRSFTTLAEVDLVEGFRGQGEAEFQLDLIKGISKENIEQFENGKTVSSVLFLYIRTSRTQTYSWSDSIDKFLFSGPSFSFIYFIQKQ